jgi:hypothetical protein
MAEILALNWADDEQSESAFWLHAASRRGTQAGRGDQLGTTPWASLDSSGYVFMA